MNYQAILDEIYDEIKPNICDGEVANYIPSLAKVNPNQFAMSITMFDGKTYSVGCCDTRFSIQSISKVFTLTQALKIYNKDLYKRVGKEPSGNPFNSLIQLEYEKGIPRNPFINAGAIAVTDSLITHFKNPNNTFHHLISFIHKITDKNDITYDKDVYKSECETGYRNIALANLMKSFGNIDNNIDDAVKTYFKHCSIRMSTNELSRSMLYLANHGTDPITNDNILTISQAKRINAIMLTCGHYDASGDFAFHVGLPGKSGVGGGIIAIVPNLMSISVFSPRLNDWGNSLTGTKALKLFTDKSSLSIF